MVQHTVSWRFILAPNWSFGSSKFVTSLSELKYLESTSQRNGHCKSGMKKREQAGLSGWRRVSAVICDKGMAARVKKKVYNVVVRPAVACGSGTVALTKRQERELEVAG